MNTPQWKRFDASVFGVKGNDENFFEWASADLVIANFAANWRPTDRLRLGATFVWQQVDRRTDGSTVFLDGFPGSRWSTSSPARFSFGWSASTCNSASTRYAMIPGPARRS